MIGGIDTTIPLHQRIIGEQPTSSTATTTSTGWRSWSASRSSAGMLEITPELLLQAYRIGVFPWASAATIPSSTGSIPACAPCCRSTASTCRAGWRARCAPAAFEVSADTRLPRCHARLRRSRGPAIRELDQLNRSSISTGAASARPRPQHRVPAGETASWSAASTACRWARRSSARACSAANATPRRWRWSISWRG